MAKPAPGPIGEALYEAMGWWASQDGEVGDVVPPRTNLSLRPNSEGAALLTGSGTYTTSQVLASAEGVDPVVEGHRYLTKSVYAGGADSNVGFFAFTFPAAGTYTLSIYCLLPEDWDGGTVEWSTEGYTGFSELDILKAGPAGKGSWRRVVARATVVAGDLVGNLVLRAVPTFPTVGKALYFDAKQVETGEEATEYIDGGLPNCEWMGTPNASASKFLGYDTTWPLLAICDAIAKVCLEPIYEVVAEGPNGEAGWSLRLDPERGPASGLAFLSQWVGAILTPEMDEEQRRAEIEAPTGWNRGQLPSIKLVGQRGLTGTKRIIVRPNESALGWHFIRTLSSETPSPAREEANLRLAIPAWSALDYEAMVGVTWEDIAASFAGWAEVKSKFTSWADLTDTLPSELPG
jgi:hypothetical protein